MGVWAWSARSAVFGVCAWLWCAGVGGCVKPDGGTDAAASPDAAGAGPGRVEAAGAGISGGRGSSTPGGGGAAAAGPLVELVSPRLEEGPGGEVLVSERVAQGVGQAEGLWSSTFPDGLFRRTDAARRGQVVCMETTLDREHTLRRTLRDSRLSDQLVTVSVDVLHDPSSRSGGAGVRSGALRLDVLGAGRWSGPVVRPLPMSTAWQRVEQTVYVPAGADRLQVSIQLPSGSGRMFVDGWSVVRQDLSGLPGGGSGGAAASGAGAGMNLVLGGDFETGVKQLAVGAYRGAGEDRVRVPVRWGVESDGATGRRSLRLDAAEGVWSVQSNWSRVGPGAHVAGFYARASEPTVVELVAHGAAGPVLRSRVEVDRAWARYEVVLPGEGLEGGAGGPGGPGRGPALGLLSLELCSVGEAREPRTVWLDGLSLHAGEMLPETYVDGEAAAMSLSFGREQSAGVANVFDAGEGVRASVRVLNRLDGQTRIPLELRIRDGFGRLVQTHRTDLSAGPRDTAEWVVPLSLPPGWYVGEARAMPPPLQFGSAVPSVDERAFSVVVGGSAGATGMQGSRPGLRRRFGMHVRSSLPAGWQPLGLSYVRCVVPWRRVEPVRGGYVLDPEADLAAEAASAGLESWFVLGPVLGPTGYPAWMPAGSDANTPSVQTPWSDLASTLIRVLGPRGATAYQVLEGPATGLNPRQYTLFHTLVRTHAEANQPGAQVVANGGVLEETASPAAWLESLLAASPRLARGPVAVGHSPEVDGRPELAIFLSSALEPVRQRHALRDVWDTGTGPGGRSGYRHRVDVSAVRAGVGAGVDAAGGGAGWSAAMLVRSLVLRSQAGFSRLTWRAVLDEPANLVFPARGAFALEYDQTLTPAAVAFGFAAGLLGAAEPLGVVELRERAGLAAVFRETDGTLLVFVWQPVEGVSNSVSVPYGGPLEAWTMFGTPLEVGSPRGGLRLVPGAAPLILRARGSAGAALGAGLESVRRPAGGG